MRTIIHSMGILGLLWTLSGCSSTAILNTIEPTHKNANRIKARVGLYIPPEIKERITDAGTTTMACSIWKVKISSGDGYRNAIQNGLSSCIDTVVLADGPIDPLIARKARYDYYIVPHLGDEIPIITINVGGLLDYYSTIETKFQTSVILTVCNTKGEVIQNVSVQGNGSYTERYGAVNMCALMASKLQISMETCLREISDHISRAMYGVLNAGNDRPNDHEGMVFGKIQATIANLPGKIFPDSLPSPVCYCQPAQAEKDILPALGSFSFATSNKDKGWFAVKLPAGSYALTHVFIPSWHNYFSSYDTLMHDSTDRASLVDSIRYVTFDVIPNRAVYIGTLSLDVSPVYNLEDLTYRGYIDKDSARHNGDMPASGGGYVLINTPGQLNRVRLNTDEYQLADAAIDDRDLTFTFRKHHGDVNRFVYGTSEFSLRTHWSVLNDEQDALRYLRINLPDMSSIFGNGLVHIVPQ